MDWQDYRDRFVAAANSQGHSEHYIDRHLTYARVLFERGYPVIFDREHFSGLVGFESRALERVSKKPTKFYVYYVIPKRNGGYRLISEPTRSLKRVQKWILENILQRFEIHSAAQAYGRGCSTQKNAAHHVGREKLLRLDIRDFFPSLGLRLVTDSFMRMGYNRDLALLMAGLCTRSGLPQGAPTSPALSNIIMERADRRLSTFAKKNHISYTRYADDLFFSGNFNAGRIIAIVRRVLDDEGLQLNARKTRLMRPHQRQQVTGVVVNDKVQAPRKVRRELRQISYYIKKYGAEGHLKRQEFVRPSYFQHWLGVCNYVLFLNPKDEDALGCKQCLLSLLHSQT